MKSNQGSRRLSLWQPSGLRGATILMLVFCTILPVSGRNSRFQLCFPNTQWPGFTGGSPDVTKPIDTDSGWSGAVRYVFGNGTPPPDVVIQGIQDSNNIYVSIEANNMTDWEDTNAVTLTFDSGNGAGSMQRLFILPLPSGIAQNDLTGGIAPFPAFEVDYAQDSTVSAQNPAGLWNSPTYTSSHPAAAIKVRATYTCANDGTNCLSGGNRWTLALQIPITTQLPPATNNPPAQVAAITVPSTPGTPFGFYVNVIRAVNGNAQQVTWPNTDPTCPIGNPQCQSIKGCSGTSAQGCTPETNNGAALGGGTPDPNFWGFASIGGSSCRGVSIGSQDGDIYTNQGMSLYNGVNEPKISTTSGAQNIFSAIAHNDSIDGTVNPVTPVLASQVFAKFEIADFGLNAPGQWSSIPPAGGSTCPFTSPNPTNPQDIGASDQATFNAGPWCLTASQIAHYSQPQFAHQCIRVTLDSNGPGTTILNTVGFQNMNFGSPAKLKGVATIGTKGYAPRQCPPGQTCADQWFDLQTATTQAKFGEACSLIGKGGKGQPGNARTISSAASATGERAQCSEITFVVHGCRHTGTYITINNKKVELCDGVGAFGFGHQFAGDAQSWSTSLSGPGLQKTGANTYSIHVPQDSATVVTTELEPEYPGEDKLAVFFDLGAAIPQGTFGNAFNKGFSLNAGLEYVITPQISAEGIFGYHHFPGNLVGNENVYQFSANVKVYLNNNWPFKPFVNGGVGGYKFSPGDPYFGGNFGAGALWPFPNNPHWGVQGSYNFHAVNTPGAASKFSTVQGGIRYVF
jgi:hypothetical protein